MRHARKRIFENAIELPAPGKRHVLPRLVMTALLAGFVGSFTYAGVAVAGSGDKVAKANAVIGQYLQTHPEMVIDFSNVSGEYCINALKVQGGHMTHYAIDPSKTTEDVIVFVDAQPLIDAGVDFSKLPRLPSRLGGMKNGQWYYLPKGGVDPHHGSKQSKRAMLVRATNVQ